MAHGSSGAQISLREGYQTSWRALTEVLREDPTLFAVDESKTKPPTATEEGFMQGTRDSYLITLWIDAQGKDTTSIQVQAGKAMFTDGPTQQNLAQALLNAMIKKFDAYHQQASAPKQVAPGGRSAAPVATPVAAPVSAASSGSSAPTMTVEEAQMKLNALGFPVGKPDGAIGPKTRGQLMRFQQSRGIAATGALDAATTTELMK
jgi:hypothetical protein